MAISRDCHCINGKDQDNNYNMCIDKIFDYFESLLIKKRKPRRKRISEGMGVMCKTCYNRMVLDYETCNQTVCDILCNKTKLVHYYVYEYNDGSEKWVEIKDKKKKNK